MFIVLRKSSVKRTLVLAILLIFAGISLLVPQIATAKEPDLLYLYPMPQNNPVQAYGLFFSETPQAGAHPLTVWKESYPNKQLVVGYPEEFQISQAMLGNNIGNYILARIQKKVKDRTVETINKKDNKTEPPSGGNKEVIFIKRQVGDVMEEVRVEIGEHLRNTDTFEKIYDSLNKGLIPKETLEKEIDNHKPVPQPTPQEKTDNTEATTMVFGGTLILSGLALLAKVLVFAL